MRNQQLLNKDTVLTELVERLIKAYQPKQIFLFGSTAREDQGPDSDYDLLLIVSDNAGPEKKRSRLAYQALRGTSVAADVLVWTETAFNQRLHIVASLPATVKREGKLLYAA